MRICPQCGNDFDDQIEVCPADRSKLIPIDSSDSDPMLGKLLDGRYRLVRKIGEGGMGAIYRAVHTEMSRTCAIKLLTALSPGKEDAIARFKREAKMASSIDNIHAATIYDFGQADDGNLFLAMEFIDGQPLSRVIAEHRALPIERVIHITNQIAEALAAAHALGIVHRDLKPDNVMITRKGADADFVKVLDFGIAKTVADDSGDNLTKTGFVLGTPVYMSPEQLLGEKLDPRSDIYSLAIIVYEMLTGKLPFDGDNPQAVMMKRVMGEPIRLRVIAPSQSESIEQVVMAGLQRNREARTATAETFAAELSRVLHSGTQIMGGVVTGKLGGSVEGRSTVQWGGAQTQVDSSPAFTGQSESSRAPSSGRGDSNVWAPTEIGPAVTQPQPLGQTARTPPPPTPPVFAAPATVPDLSAVPFADQPVASLADQVVTRPERRTGKWVLLAGVLMLAVIAAILYVIWPSTSGFTLVVKGAPSGSQVFINSVPRAAVAADGALRVAGLDPGSVSVRVSHEGFSDFMTTVAGSKGEIQTCEARLLPMIDYNGVMVPIPAGEFEMGSNDHGANERPAHKVNLAAYYIDKYEVTNAEYKKFCDETHRAYPPNPATDPNYFTAKPDYPVWAITFEDALAYASWAGKRLPTEEEWEKAASWDPVTHTKRQYPWGDDFASGRANIDTGQPVPVRETSVDSSPYGVFGMAGNVTEWVDAPYKAYEGSRSVDPDYNKNERVIKGGTYIRGTKPDEARTSYRRHLPRVFPTGMIAPVGIRCVVAADDPRIQSLLRARGN